MNQTKHLSIPDWLPGNRWHHSFMDGLLLALGLLIVVVSYYNNPVYPDINLIGPSGAILVIVGAIVEYRHNSYEKIAINKSILYSAGEGEVVIFSFALHRKLLKWASHICVIAGSIIWAYASVFLKLFA